MVPMFVVAHELCLFRFEVKHFRQDGRFTDFSKGVSLASDQQSRNENTDHRERNRQFHCDSD